MSASKPKQRLRSREPTRVAALVVLAYGPILAATALLAPDADRVPHLHAVSWLVANLTLLVSAVAFYGHYRITDDPAVGWLTVPTAAVAVHTVPFAFLLATSDGSYGVRARTGEHLDALIIMAAIAVIWWAYRQQFTPRFNPLLLGSGVGLAAAGLRLLDAQLQASGQAVSVLQLPPALVQATVVVCVVGAAILVLRLRRLEPRIRIRLAAVIVCLAIGYVLRPTSDDFIGALGALSLSITLLANAVLAVLAIGLLIDALNLQRHRFHRMVARAERAEASLERDAEMLHELRSTLVGLDNATGLLRARNDLSRQHRQRLESLVEVEMHRLAAMLSLAPPNATPLAVDEVIAPLVEGQRVAGVAVDWAPSGHRAVFDRTCLAEIVHVLLTNAARHAPGSPVQVSTVQRPGVLEIRVCDRGPGVPPDLGEAVFGRGVRGRGSIGQGIGLSAARRRANEQGGSVSLEPPPDGVGSCFVLRVPLADRPIP